MFELKWKICMLGMLIAWSSCTEESMSTSGSSIVQIAEKQSVDTMLPNVPTIDKDTLDTSFDLYRINSSASRFYRTEYVPLSEGLQSGIEPDMDIIPDSLLGDSVQTFSDTVVLLKDHYRASALEYAGVQETDSVYIYNFDRDVITSRSVADLPLIAFINVYGADLPVTTTDYMFGLDIQGITERNSMNHYEDEIASIHHSNPFEVGAIQKIKWFEIDTSEYPSHLKKTVQNYEADRCFQFKFELLTYYCRTYLSEGVPRGFKIDVLENESPITTLYSFSGEGSEPIFSMLYGYESPNQWTGRLFRGTPPIIHNLYSLSFGCPKVFFIQEESFKYLICDNRH